MSARIDMVGQPDGPLAEAAPYEFVVEDTQRLSPGFQRVVFSSPALSSFTYRVGQDLMLRVPADDRIVNRRYSIRAFDARTHAITVDVTLHGEGPGTTWIRGASVGSRIEGVAPRGKITLDTSVSRHVFLGDDAGLPVGLAMIERLAAESSAIGLYEVDAATDEQFPTDPNATVALSFVHRSGSAAGDPTLLLAALETIDLGEDTHVYVMSEVHVMRAIQSALDERGLSASRISTKAYWRRGAANADHGEPSRD